MGDLGRLLGWAAGALTLACCATENPPPAITSLDPNIVSSRVETTAVINGRNLFQEVEYLGLGKNESLLFDDLFEVEIDGTAVQQATVSWIDPQSMEIVFPPGLDIGTHELGLTIPDGRSYAEPFTVVDCLVDVCGDGCCEGTENRTNCSLDCSPTLPLCDASLTELVACYEFEDGLGAAVLVDSSMYANDAVVSNALFVTGVDESALQGSPAFSSTVPDSMSMDVATELTIEGWLQLDVPVDLGRQGIFDNENQYGFFVVAQDALRCTVGNLLGLSPNGVLVPGQWQHVACTFDGDTLRIFVDGVVVAEEVGGGAISTSEVIGSSIGENSPDGDELIGKLDTLRIWSTGRTAEELCAGAGIACR
jgi:hypothetical protein